jgi:hypothetical protein
MTDQIQEVVVVGPFAGVRQRAYDQSILEKVDWYSIKTTYIYFHELWLTQNKVQINALFGGQKFSQDPNIRVVVWQGFCYLEDGHHRAVHAAMLGRRNFPARLYFADLLRP